MQIISIDVGRDRVKATNGIKEIVFKSTVGSHHILNISPSITDYDVCINGKNLFIGHLAEIESEFPIEIITESKAHPETKMLLLTALALLVDPNEEYKIYCGMPINQHSIECKSKLMKFLSGKHEVVIRERKFPVKCKDKMSKQLYAMLHDVPIEEKKVSVELNNENFLISPEAISAYWNEILDNEGNEIDTYKLLDKVVRVIDVGKRTVNYCTLIKGKQEKSESGSLNYGTVKLEKVTSMTNEDKEFLTRNIVADLSKVWTDYDNDTFLFTGGGSLLLKDFICINYIDKKIMFCEDPLMSNARGLYKMAVLENKDC